jgi:hypothetical protein
MRIRRFCESKKDIDEDNIIDCFQDYLDLLTNESITIKNNEFEFEFIIKSETENKSLSQYFDKTLGNFFEMTKIQLEFSNCLKRFISINNEYRLSLLNVSDFPKAVKITFVEKNNIGKPKAKINLESIYNFCEERSRDLDSEQVLYAKFIDHNWIISDQLANQIYAHTDKVILSVYGPYDLTDSLLSGIMRTVLNGWEIDDIQDEYESIVFETADINDLSSNQIFIRDGDDVMMVVDIQTLDYFSNKDVIINSRYEMNRKDIVVLIVE